MVETDRRQSDIGDHEDKHENHDNHADDHQDNYDEMMMITTISFKKLL